MFKIAQLVSLMLMSLFLPSASCQNNAADSVAVFPGGGIELYSYLEKNMNWRQGQLTVEGIVHVSFIVKKDGAITEAIVEKGLCDSCDVEALRLVREMPNWIPARKDNRPVESKVTIPIYFGLSQRRE